MAQTMLGVLQRVKVMLSANQRPKVGRAVKKYSGKRETPASGSSPWHISAIEVDRTQQATSTEWSPGHWAELGWCGRVPAKDSVASEQPEAWGQVKWQKRDLDQNPEPGPEPRPGAPGWLLGKALPCSGLLGARLRMQSSHAGTGASSCC